MHRYLLVYVLLTASLSIAQELEPGAYSVSPVGVNIAVVTNSFNKGDLNFDPTLPIEDAKATINVTAIGYVRALNVVGRSGNVGVVAPYTVGNLEGRYLGQFQQLYRSGLRDPAFRFAVNLYGAPAMNLKQFAGYRQKTNIGASVVVTAPLGQYDPNKLINIGQNRWAIKPEIGISQALAKWRLEGYLATWFFTGNNSYYGGKTRTQRPISSVQLHVVRIFRQGFWASFDANYYMGGRTSVDGQWNLDIQRNSRVGGTVAVPLDRRNSIKFSYSRGARTNIGGDFNALSVAYQYLWGAGI